MRNALPKKRNKKECAIVNLDDADKPDSFGELLPPLELIRYFGNAKMKYNYNKYQNFNSIKCGHLCLRCLYK